MPSRMPPAANSVPQSPVQYPQYADTSEQYAVNFLASKSDEKPEELAGHAHATSKMMTPGHRCQQIPCAAAGAPWEKPGPMQGTTSGGLRRISTLGPDVA